MSKVGSNNVKLDAHVTTMTVSECVSMGHGLEQVGQKSAVYLASAALQAVIPPVIKDAKELDAADKDVDIKYLAYTTAVNLRNDARNTFNKDASAALGVAKAVCKTPQELNQLSFTERPAVLSVPVTPTKVIANPGKIKGTGTVHCPRFGGFTEYDCEISADPPTAATWVTQVGGGQAKRTITGLVSGQRYWVRFRTRRGKAVSDWSEAVPFVAA